jgi:hypothetical protein
VVRLRDLAHRSRADARAARDRDDDRRRRLSFHDDATRELVQLRPLASRGVAHDLERVFDADAQALGEDALRLLDHDPRLERLA